MISEDVTPDVAMWANVSERIKMLQTAMSAGKQQANHMEKSNEVQSGIDGMLSLGSV